MTSEDWINNYIDAEVRLIRSLPIKDIDAFIGSESDKLRLKPINKVTEHEVFFLRLVNSRV